MTRRILELLHSSTWAGVITWACSKKGNSIKTKVGAIKVRMSINTLAIFAEGKWLIFQDGGDFLKNLYSAINERIAEYKKMERTLEVEVLRSLNEKP